MQFRCMNPIDIHEYDNNGNPVEGKMLHIKKGDIVRRYYCPNRIWAADTVRLEFDNHKIIISIQCLYHNFEEV